jgi:hypothetical protein
MTIPVEHIAETIAREAHAPQMYDEAGFYDLGGEWIEPRTYVDGHLLPAVETVRYLGYVTSLYAATTWLHDTVEDTEVTLEYLRQRCLPYEVVHAVDLLTRKPRQSHEEYLAGIATSDYAIVAKFADSAVNLANTLCQRPPVPREKYRSRVGKYLVNMVYLQPLLPPTEDNGVRLEAA